MAFKKGKSKFREEFNFFNLIKTIQKMKAAVSMLLEESDVNIKDVKESYF